MTTLPAWLIFALFALIVVAAHILEGITGFGSTALSMPFLTLLVGVRIAKPVLTIYTLLLCVYILAREFRNVDLRVFGRMAVCLLLGLPVGIAAYSILPQTLLLGMLAFFMIAVSIRGLVHARTDRPHSHPVPGWAGLLLVFLGSVLHGAFASGGPLIVLYSADALPDKSRFRATMCLVWLTLNSLLLAQMGVADELTGDVWRMTVCGLPFLILGTLLGDAAHRRVSAQKFTVIMYVMLLLSGAALIWNLLT